MVIGMGDLGVEHVAEKGFVCRGVLLDAAKYRGMERLPVPTGRDSPGIITADDVKAMVQAQGLEEIGESDCVFIHTGHGDLWGKPSGRPSPPRKRRSGGRSSARASPASASARANISPSGRSS